MTEKLKSCPFCGGEAIKGKNGHGNWGGCSESECYVQTRVFWTEGEAVQAWNARAADDDTEQLKRDLLTQIKYAERLAEVLKATRNLLKKNTPKESRRKPSFDVGRAAADEWGAGMDCGAS